MEKLHDWHITLYELEVHHRLNTTRVTEVDGGLLVDNDPDKLALNEAMQTQQKEHWKGIEELARKRQKNQWERTESKLQAALAPQPPARYEAVPTIMAPIANLLPASVTEATAIALPETEVNGASLPGDAPTWALIAPPDRMPGYRWQLYQFLKAAHDAKEPYPKAEQVIEAWKSKPPPGLQVIQKGRNESLQYELAHGGKKEAHKKAIQSAIKDLVVRTASD